MTIQSKRSKGIVRMGLERHLSALLDILKMEIRSFNAVMELLILEERSLVTCDHHGLADVVERQSDLLTSIACLEKSRTEVLERIAEEVGGKADALTISRLARLVGDPWRKELQETAEILSHVYEDIRRKKTSNSLLIRQGIVMVENDIRIILKACGRGLEKRSVYTSSANRNDISGSVYLDGKI